MTETMKRELRRILNNREIELRRSHNDHLRTPHPGALQTVCGTCDELQAAIREVMYLRRTHCPSRDDLATTWRSTQQGSR